MATTRLYVLYDSRCVLCRRLKVWMTGEPAWWPLRAVAAGSDRARRLFPALETDGKELIVVASDGRYWQGDHAWLIVLFALERYRGWAKRLSTPLLLPLARQAFAAVSESRDSLGWWMSLRTGRETADYLKQQAVPGCDVP
jgi:predicted DCC family thiol-disulfide oxidoreductase YuxK